MCLLCSDNIQTPTNAETLKFLKAKYPPAPIDRRPACSYTGNLRFQPLKISLDDIIKCLKIFLVGSAGGHGVLFKWHAQTTSWNIHWQTLSTCTSRVPFLYQSERSYTDILRNVNCSPEGRWRHMTYGSRLHPLMRSCQMRKCLSNQTKKSRAETNSSWCQGLWRYRGGCTRHMSSPF